jgi:hypothetical protein
MLMSDAIERSVSQIDFSALSGRDVYVDGKYIAGLVDEKYVMSTLRQHMFASGCIVKDKIDDASYVVEVRAGALGTNRNDLLWGVPATTLPAGGAMLPLVPTSIPELSLMKRTHQQGVCKVAVFAYDRISGHPVWQSGIRQQVSKAKDTWVFGTGPFQRGTIYDGTKFAGERLDMPLAGDTNSKKGDKVWVAHEILFHEEPRVAGARPPRTQASEAAAPQATAPPPETGPSPSVMTTSTFGGGTQVTSAGATPASGNQATPPQSGQTSAQQSSAPNSAAGAFGAVQAVDWARTVRQNYTR